jgi:hypothetical protein
MGVVQYKNTGRMGKKKVMRENNKAALPYPGGDPEQATRP